MITLRCSLENKIPSILKIETYFPALWMPPGTANNELRSSEFLLKSDSKITNKQGSKGSMKIKVTRIITKQNTAMF